MPEIYLTPSMLEDTAVKMDQQQEVLNNFLNNVDNVVNNLLSDWKGDAQTSFANAWAEKKDTYKNFTMDIANFSKFLRTYARSMGDIDAQEKVQ